MVKPMKTLEWHYPMIQFLIKFVYRIVRHLSAITRNKKNSKRRIFLHFQPVLQLAGKAPVRGHRHLLKDSSVHLGEPFWQVVGSSYGHLSVCVPMMSAYEILHCIHIKTGKSVTKADALSVLSKISYF